MQYVQLWCDKWCMMWNVMWWATCGVMFCVMWNELQCYCTMLCHITPPHGFVIRNGACCGAVWCGMRYGTCTMLCSRIPHLTAQHSTLHISSCNTVHTMLCHIAPQHTAHHVICGVLSCVLWNGHVECGVVQCGMHYNVTTPCSDITPPHIAHHSCTFPHCTTPQQHNSTSDCTTFHISSCYTVQTMLCHIAPPCIAHHVM